MTKLSTDELISAFQDLTLLELSAFVKQFEETFGVSAAAVQAPMGVATGQPVEEVEEQDEFDVILDAAGDKKIQVIKEVRAYTKLGLKEAKDLVDAAPKPILEKVDRPTAEKLKDAIEAVGGSVTIR